jgi:hypothetical protein
MSANNLLIESTRKLITLTNIQGWTNELLDKAPPVLWFGNSKSEKPKILTFGANPSRWEFLDQPASKNCQMVKSVYENLYLTQSNRRFYQLDQNSCYSDILGNQKLQNDIIESYDNYFKSGNSYRWFGKNKTDSYNAEGLLRGCCASYFENDTKYRACHIDLFPFATISDFKKIQIITERDVLAKNWAKNIVDELLCLLRPEIIIIFGISNFNYFCKYFIVSKGRPKVWSSISNKGKCNYNFAKYKTLQIIGLSVNLGNPKGVDASGLTELGQKLRWN